MDAGVPVPTGLIALAGGYSATCAVLADKTARCWGRNNEGQLGDGTTTDRDRPVAVMNLTNIATLSLGYEHACASKEDGTAWCWGRNLHGQLGNNTMTDSEVPVQVQGLTTVASIHAGTYQTCARLNDGTVSCWGRGGYLGTTNLTNTPLPTPVSGLTGVAQLDVSSNANAINLNHVCGRRMNGTAFCWGDNSDGQLGDGTQNFSRTPRDIPNMTDAIELAAGGSHACARRTSGYFCWGFSSGDGTFQRRFSPTAVMTNATVTSIEAGADYTLARTSTNGLICWGRSSRGQCGDSLASFPASGPVYLAPVNGTVTGATLIAGGGTHACAYVASTMITWCWGSSDWGELGYGEPGMPSRTAVPDFVRW